MRFDWVSPSRILFGRGRISEIGGLLASWEKRILVIGGKSKERISPLVTLLHENGKETFLFQVRGEPSLPMVEEAVQLAREWNAEAIVAMGGGSVLDLAKAVAALFSNPGHLLEYLEVIGQGKPLLHSPIPLLAIPTTAGTGAEVTYNAVIFSPEHQVKVSLRNPMLVPRSVLIDPDVLATVPIEVAVASGLDAFTQLIEPYTCISPNPLVDPLCVEGIRRIARSFLPSLQRPADPNALEDMAFSALLSGFALANAKLGAVHGIAGPLGGLLGIPHGVICARLLPVVMEKNIRSLQKDSLILSRYREIAQILTGRASAQPEEAVQWIHHIVETFHVPRLGDFGLNPSHFPFLVERSSKASSMKGNPVPLGPTEIQEILQKVI